MLDTPHIIRAAWEWATEEDGLTDDQRRMLFVGYIEGFRDRTALNEKGD